MCKEKNIYLIDNTNKIKAQHLNKDKYHLNERVLMYLVVLLSVSYLGFSLDNVNQILTKKLQMATGR